MIYVLLGLIIVAQALIVAGCILRERDHVKREKVHLRTIAQWQAIAFDARDNSDRWRALATASEQQPIATMTTPYWRKHGRAH